MQKHVNFESGNCVHVPQRRPSHVRHCLTGAASVMRRGSARTVLEQTPRPRAISHVRQPPAIRATRPAATPVHFLSLQPPPPQYNQVVTTFPSLVEAINTKQAEMDEERDARDFRRHYEPERLKSQECACRRCSTRLLSPARRSSASLRRFRDNIAQFSERGTMTTDTNDAVCEAQTPQSPQSPHSRVINVQRSEIPVRRSPSMSSRHTDRSPTGSILKVPSNCSRLNNIKYQEPERDLHEAESFPQRDLYYEEADGLMNGYLERENIYPFEKIPDYPCISFGVGSGSITVGRERECRFCTPQSPKDGIPFSHRYCGSRYHKHCVQPFTEEFGFYRTSVVSKPQLQPWYPVTNSSNVFYKPKQDGIRRPRRVLSSERNIEMYIDEKDVDLMIRRNRYY